MTPLTLEEQSRVWDAVQKPYRLSLHYEARVIRIDSQERREQAVVLTRGHAPAERRAP
jgi:hypothetical protein